MTAERAAAELYADLEVMLRGSESGPLGKDLWFKCILLWNHYQGLADGQPTA